MLLARTGHVEVTQNDLQKRWQIVQNKSIWKSDTFNTTVDLMFVLLWSMSKWMNRGRECSMSVGSGCGAVINVQMNESDIGHSNRNINHYLNSHSLFIHSDIDYSNKNINHYLNKYSLCQCCLLTNHSRFPVLYLFIQTLTTETEQKWKHQSLSKLTFCIYAFRH